MSSQPRRFSILDAMILISAFAVGLSLQKSHATDFALYLRDTNRPTMSLRGILQVVVQFIRVSSPWGLATTFAFLGIQLRPPRPRRLIRQPGFAACLVAFATFGLEVAAVGLFYVIEALTDPASGWGYLLPSPPFIRHAKIDPMQNPRDPFPSFLTTLCRHFVYWIAPCMGVAVAAAWLVLALLGWRRERTWIGRLGVVVGIYWMLLAMLVRLSLIFEQILS